MIEMLSDVPGRRLTAPGGLGAGVADCAGGAGDDCGVMTPSNCSASCTENKKNININHGPFKINKGCRDFYMFSVLVVYK